MNLMMRGYGGGMMLVGGMMPAGGMMPMTAMPPPTGQSMGVPTQPTTQWQVNAGFTGDAGVHQPDASKNLTEMSMGLQPVNSWDTPVQTLPPAGDLQPPSYDSAVVNS